MNRKATKGAFGKHPGVPNKYSIKKNNKLKPTVIVPVPVKRISWWRRFLSKILRRT